MSANDCHWLKSNKIKYAFYEQENKRHAVNVQRITEGTERRISEALFQCLWVIIKPTGAGATKTCTLSRKNISFIPKG